MTSFDLSAAVQSAMKSAFDVAVDAVPWERPSDAEHGDIATPVALQQAKQIGKAPREIAEAIAQELGAVVEIAKVEVAGPGYVNVWLQPTVLLQGLQATADYCSVQPPKKDIGPVVMDYSHPNIAKPFAVHHVLSTVIGQAICNIHRHLGYEVVPINHIGDWGTQFGKLYVAVTKWGGDTPIEDYSVDELLSYYVRFHEEAEKDETLDEEARRVFARLEQGDKEIEAFWKQVVTVSMQEIEQTYKRLQVSLEVMGESFYNDKMVPIVEEGKQKGVFTTGDKGALVAQFPEDDNMPPAVIVKADGASIYHTRDLATVRYRCDTWKPSAILYVVDVAQQLYFKQLFDIVGQLGWDLPHLEHVIFGRMSFADGGMSTRKGNVIRLESVLDEGVDRAQKAIAERGDAIQTDDPAALAEMMGVGAVVYGILSQNRRMDMVFDWDKMLSFDGNSAPYLQYTHARARSILRKAKYEKGDWPEVMQLTLAERRLVNHLQQYPTILEEARKAYMPHMLAGYLYELCQVYNSFYNAETIVKASEPQRSLRLKLTQLTADVLRAGAELLTLRVPDSM